MTQNNLKQASLIPSAKAVPNPVGSAPGWWVEKDGRLIVSMPGVPREMYRMWHEEVVPRLRAHASTSNAVIVSRTVKLMGIGESAAEEMIRHLLASTNPTIGTYAKQDGIHLRLTSKATTAAEAGAAITPVEEKLRLILGDYIYGYDDDTPSSVIADLMLGRGQTLGLIETSTGGHVASTIMEDPRAAAFFKGASVAPSLAALVALGVPEPLLAEKGIASMEAAEAMARCARAHFGASMGLGVTGAFSREEAGATPFGSINIALDDRELRTSSAAFPTLPAEIRRWAMLNALNLVRLRLLGSL